MSTVPSIPPQAFGSYSAAPGQDAPVHLPAAVYQQALAQGMPGQQPVIIVQQPAQAPARQLTPAVVAAVLGGGALLVTLLLAVAVVAVAVAVGAVSLTVGWMVLKSLAGGSRR